MFKSKAKFDDYGEDGDGGEDDDEPEEKTGRLETEFWKLFEGVLYYSKAGLEMLILILIVGVLLSRIYLGLLKLPVCTCHMRRDL